MNRFWEITRPKIAILMNTRGQFSVFTGARPPVLYPLNMPGWSLCVGDSGDGSNGIDLRKYDPSTSASPRSG